MVSALERARVLARKAKKLLTDKRFNKGDNRK